MNSTLLCFIASSAALTIAPGPDNIFILTQGITGGKRPAIITALGMCSGLSVHTTAAACGISAIFYSSVLAFNLVKFAGTAYLLYLAYKTVRHGSSLTLPTHDIRNDLALFKRGFFMNVLNPKVAMFFLAYLPQFAASPTAGKFVHRMLMLGVIFMAQATAIFCLIGYFSGCIGNFILTHPRVARYFDWLATGVLASLGARLAFSKR